jgi:hypothetical protein
MTNTNAVRPFHVNVPAFRPLCGAYISNKRGKLASHDAIGMDSLDSIPTFPSPDRVHMPSDSKQQLDKC